MQKLQSDKQSFHPSLLVLLKFESNTLKHHWIAQFWRRLNEDQSSLLTSENPNMLDRWCMYCIQSRCIFTLILKAVFKDMFWVYFSSILVSMFFKHGLNRDESNFHKLSPHPKWPPLYDGQDLLSWPSINHTLKLKTELWTQKALIRVKLFPPKLAFFKWEPNR